MALVTHGTTANEQSQLRDKSPQRKKPQRLRLYLKPREVPTKTKGPFRCLYCNKTSFVSTELDFSGKIGRLKCQSCGAEFRHKITENLTCAGDVLAALLAGDKLRWLTAKQDPVSAAGPETLDGIHIFPVEVLYTR